MLMALRVDPLLILLHNPSQLLLLWGFASTNLRAARCVFVRTLFSDRLQRPIRPFGEERRGADWIVANPIKSSTRNVNTLGLIMPFG
jgi:hypothetical protein